MGWRMRVRARVERKEEGKMNRKAWMAISSCFPPSVSLKMGQDARWLRWSWLVGLVLDTDGLQLECKLSGQISGKK